MADQATNKGSVDGRSLNALRDPLRNALLMIAAHLSFTVPDDTPGTLLRPAAPAYWKLLERV